MYSFILYHCSIKPETNKKSIERHENKCTKKDLGPNTGSANNLNKILYSSSSVKGLPFQAIWQTRYPKNISNVKWLQIQNENDIHHFKCIAEEFPSGPVVRIPFSLPRAQIYSRVWELRILQATWHGKKRKKA